MAKRKSAIEIVDSSSVEQTPHAMHEGNKNPAAVALGRLGGLKGGKARARKLTPEQRKEIAKIAANARWRKNNL